MKEIAIITIIDYFNFGNRLQNYALQEVLKEINCNSITLLNYPYRNTHKNYLFRQIKHLFNKPTNKDIRYNYFDNFNKRINFSKRPISIYSNLNKFDYVIVGSDQVWNPNIGRLRDLDLLMNVNPNKRISYAASFGVSKLDLDNNYQEKIKGELLKFKNISVREESGKEIIFNLIGRTDTQVVLDPTMLLLANDWEKVIKIPEQINSIKEKKYILNYFLGDLLENNMKKIQMFADENDCEIINLLDVNSIFYNCGPSEFLYLIKNAYLICTDSFHSSVFSILFHKPFLVFERKDAHINMGSRISSLLNKFNLNSNYFDGTVNKKIFNTDYSNVDKKLEDERKKSIDFLIRALEIQY